MSDIIAAFRQGWVFLAVYYVITVSVAVFVWRKCRLSRFLSRRKSRLILAAAFALLFTPSVISDFWLFMIPGPALLGFLFILPSVISYPQFLLVELVYYVLPMAVGFGITYCVFLQCDGSSYVTPSA